MSKTGTLDIIGNVQGDGSNDSFRLSTTPWAINLTDTPGNRTSLALVGGFNSVPIQASLGGTKAAFVLLLPPSVHTNAMYLKGVTGDTGIKFTNQPFLVPIDAAATAIGITITGDGSLTIEAIWF
jgi:hypothetical protein